MDICDSGKIPGDVKEIIDKFVSGWKEAEFNNLCKDQCESNICKIPKVCKYSTYQMGRNKRQTAVIRDSIIKDSVLINGYLFLIENTC